MSELENRKVRVICGIKNGKNPYANFPYIIPVVPTKVGYNTGQALTKAKMLNESLLTTEEREKFPFVVNPEDLLRVNNKEWLNLDHPVDKARYDLLILSGVWAKSKKEFDDNQAVFVGYLEDRSLEAKSKNNQRDLQFEAETLVRNAPLADYSKIALMLNGLIPSFNASVTNLTEDEIKDRILEACTEYPEKVKLCFKKNNPSVEFEYFILELIQYSVLSKKPDGSYFDGKDYIGRNLVDIEQWLDKKENSYRRNKWAGMLQEKKGKTGAPAVSKQEEEQAMIDACEKALYKKDKELSGEAIDKLSKFFPSCDRLTEFRNNLDLLNASEKKEEEPKDNIVEATKFSEQLAKQTLEQLQKTIKHHLSIYKEEDCKEIWGNKDALISYMVKTKFNK